MMTSSVHTRRADREEAVPAAHLASPPSGPPRHPAAAPHPLRKAAIVLVSLEQSLASQFLARLDRSAVEAVTWEIARLERIDPVEQAAVLEEFLSLCLRRLRFVFEDLLRLEAAEIRLAHRPEDMDSWALALAGAAPPVRAKVLGALDPESSRALGHLLEGLGPFRLSEVEAAQGEIADRFRRLYDEGKIVLPDPSSRDEVLV
ncbi:MAG: FliG C-terminal domain-containing protein [Isosphaeraceae bacterium]